MTFLIFLSIRPESPQKGRAWREGWRLDLLSRLRYTLSESIIAAICGSIRILEGCCRKSRLTTPHFLLSPRSASRSIYIVLRTLAKAPPGRRGQKEA